MKHIYTVTGMTCNGCVATVTNKISEISGVQSVNVSLETNEAEVFMDNQILLKDLEAVLPEKFTISEKEIKGVVKEVIKADETSKLQQLKPLLLIFAYLFSAAFLLNFKEGTLNEAMLDFMGLFYIVFSFFKLLDLKGFPESFRMYDPLAKAVPIYGWLYPFIELTLGLLFLMRFQVEFALVATVIILGVTTIGVAKALFSKKQIRCACLGTALKLPMTEATFIENTIMLVMAVFMLTQLFF